MVGQAGLTCFLAFEESPFTPDGPDQGQDSQRTLVVQDRHPSSGVWLTKRWWAKRKPLILRYATHFMVSFLRFLAQSRR